jgi:uncharacterized protein
MALQVAELLALQEIDNNIGTLEAEKGELDNGERVERALASRMTRLQQAERRQQGLQIEHRNAELELAGLEEKKHSTSRKLYEGRGTNPRELMALEQEVAMLERQRQRLSDTILRGLDDIEKAGEMVTVAKASVEEAEKALKVVKKRYEKDASRINGEMEKLMPARKKLASKIEPDVLKRYDDLRRRQHNIAAVRIINGACGGCRMKVGSTMARRIHVGETYNYCESCQRFLFAEDVPEVEVAAKVSPAKPARRAPVRAPKAAAAKVVEASVSEA